MATHFCGGKITSVQILPIVPKENPCGCDDATTPDNCCKTEIRSLQLNDEQIAVHVDQPSSPQTDVNLWADKSIEGLFSSNSIRTILPTSSPPDSPPSYILHCSLLI
ncbi:MAG: hypothetical protein ABSC53_13080 [Bacteroidota bacterium]